MQFSLFGAAPDTGNLGVSALCYSILYVIARQLPEARVTVFDHGRGRETQSIDFGDGQQVSFFRQGAVNSRRFYRSENLRLMQLAGLFGGLGNSGIKTILQSEAVLDISGGDSFTDLYGRRCFDTIILPKLLTLQQGKPLVLLPQTYGPFSSNECERKAAKIVKNARCAWARDARSFEVLKDLLGSSFDSSIHQCGVDVAFGLPTIRPTYLSQEMETYLNSSVTKVGINISGLIYNDFESSKERFSFRADYKQIVLDLIRRFLSETDCTIFLVPHVITPKGHHESDLDACHDVFSRITDEKLRKRIIIAPAYGNPCEIKWVISQFDWFCGTRMHAAIAALSSGVPVSAISYSPKTLGVFESCGQGNHVADPQVMDEVTIGEVLWSSWEIRKDSLLQYASILPDVKILLEEQTSLLLGGFHG